jgi:NADPH:quinone reductase
MQAIFIHKHGGPDVLRLENTPVPTPQRGEVLVKNKAIGVNFVDTQHHAGENYPINLPLIPGIEAAGVVEAVGEDVTMFKVGDRVGYAGYMGGNYAAYTLVPEEKLVPVPEGISYAFAPHLSLLGLDRCVLNAYSAWRCCVPEAISLL